MGVKLQSALGGSVELNAPSTASNFTMTVPAGNGTVATTDQLMGFRNRVINGAMRVNQRNGYSAFTVGTNSTIWVSDRFSAFSSGGQTFGINSAGLPSGSGFNYGLELKPQSGATSVQVNHKIESSNVEDLAGQTVTLSFWIYTTGLSGTSSYVQPYTPTAIDNYSSTVYGTAQNISYTNGQWVKNVFTFNTTNSSMNANNGLAILWNFVNAVGATIWITGVQLERGSIATDFERRPFGTEYALCQRYYQTFGGTTYAGIATASMFSTTGGIFSLQYFTPMRVAPSIGVTNLIVTDRTVFDNDIAISAITAGLNNAYLRFTNTTATPVGNGGAYLIAVKNGTTGSISASAEL